MELVHFLCENRAAIHISNNIMNHERTRYIEIDCHSTNEKVQQTITTTCHIGIKEQPAACLQNG